MFNDRIKGIQKCVVLLEVLAVNEKILKDVVVKLPHQLVTELEESFYRKSVSYDDAVLKVSTRKLVKHRQPNQIREALMKGYIEMSHINLSISSECLHAEYEAEHMVERLVSGG